MEQTVEEAKLETLNSVRDSILWFLQKRLEDVGNIQRGMMERRLEREIEKSRSILHQRRGSEKAAPVSSLEDASGLDQQSKGGNTVGSYGGKAVGLEMEDAARREIEQQLSPEQLQLFAKENNDMLKQYEDTMDQVR